MTEMYERETKVNVINPTGTGIFLDENGVPQKIHLPDKIKEYEMTNEREFSFAYLTKLIKEYAERKHCYEYEEDYTPSAASYDNAFDDGADYGEIHLARTLLERIGVEFEYPCMKKDT